MPSSNPERDSATVVSSKVDVPPSLIAGRVGAGAYTDIYEAIYAGAEGDCARIPWSEGGPCPTLVEWLNREAFSIVRAGGRAAVVGCGLGDDVVELARRGYDAIGFDISPSAVRWAARRHPQHADRFLTADLLELPTRLAGRFDLVVDAYTMQCMDPARRPAAARGIARLVAARGAVLCIERARNDDEPVSLEDGPPFALSGTELVRVMADAGLALRDGPGEFHCPDDPDHLCVRALFVKA